MNRCGNAECFGDGTASLKLQTNRPLVFVRDALRDWDQDQIWAWLREAYDRVRDVCDVDATRIMDISEAGAGDVVHLITVADLGGGGVLADQMLPNGNRVLPMRINTRIKWKPTDGPMQGGTIDPLRTLTHETLHALGLQHFPVGAPPELMEPSISQTIIRPQPTEARVLAGWYGQPVTKPNTPALGNIVINEKARTISAPGYTLV